MEDLGVERKIILELVFKTNDGAWNGLIWLRTEIGTCSYKCGDELSDFIECGKFFDSWG